MDLWKIDGTAAGTVQVKVLPQTADHLTNVAGTLFLIAEDAANGRELWRSSGTGSSTKLVKDINPGEADAAPVLSTSHRLVNVGGVLFLTAVDADHGRELWLSDGTSWGTKRVKDIMSGTGHGADPPLVALGSTACFVGVSASGGRELWRNTGTSGGTEEVANIRSGTEGSDPEDLVVVGGDAYFTAVDGVHGREVWRHDPDLVETTLVEDITP